MIDLNDRYLYSKTMIHVFLIPSSSIPLPFHSPAKNLSRIIPLPLHSPALPFPCQNLSSQCDKLDLGVVQVDPLQSVQRCEA
jgi:hypothetical protein